MARPANIETPPARLRSIVTLAAPAIAALLLQTGVLWADRIMLGHFSATALGAMQIAGPIEWTLVSVASAFAVGTLALVGRAVGAGDHAAARRHTTISMVVAVALGTIAMLAAYALVLPTLHLMFANTDAAAEVARQYLQVALLAAPFYCVGVAGFAALSAAGDTVTPLKIGVAVNVVHVGINWLLIGGHWGFPALGARGAGWSTAASYTAEALLTFAALSRAGLPASLRPFRWPFGDAAGRDALRALRRLSLHATSERVVYHVAYMAFVWMIARLGDDAMASNQALIAIEAISFMTVEGFATASGALVAQELGARRPERATWVGWASTGLAVLTLSSFGLLFLALRHQLPALVTPRADLQAEAARALIVVAIAQPFMAVGVVLGQAVRGAGATRLALFVSLFGGFVVRLVVTWIATSRGFGVMGVWMGSTADWASRTLLLIAIWRLGTWRDATRELPAG
ncbi:MAG: MATE family efflux transporter [Deltaproteobacteria bacterium]|nr:MATE family efflux transporter [Deltaproteobacteria bacterium]